MERQKSSSTQMSMRDRIKQRMREQSNESGNWCVTVPEGKKQLDKLKTKMHLDIIPYVVTVTNKVEAKKGELWYRAKYAVHRNIGIDNKVRICPLLTVKQPCPVCEARAKLLKGNAEDREIAASIKPKIRELYNVIDLDNEDAGVQLWDISLHLFGKQLEEELNNDDTGDFAAFPDLKGGYTLKCRFKEKTFEGKDFHEVSRIDFEKREDYKPSILDEAIDLDKCLKILSYEDLEKEFLGSGVVEEESIEDAEVDKHKEEKPIERKASRFREEKEEISNDDEEEKPTLHRQQKKHESEEKKENEGECPSGYKFGIDTDGKDECAECKVWEACSDEYDKRKSTRKK